LGRAARHPRRDRRCGGTFAERQRAAGNLPQLALEEQQALLDETKIDQVHAQVARRPNAKSCNG